MDRILPGRAFCISLGVALTTLLALLVASPAALARVSSTAHYSYKVVGVDYTAAGQLAGARFRGACVGIAMWEGDVATGTGGEGELSELASGKASLTIHGHGTSGSVDANMGVESKFSNAFYRETTACDSSESETAFTLTPCMQAVDSKLHVHVRIAGGVGTRVKLSWYFFQHNGAAGKLVPDTFSCVEPYQFPDGSCTTRATLNAFTSKTVKLPFSCFFSTSTPPPGRNYTKYLSAARATGALHLKRM